MTINVFTIAEPGKYEYAAYDFITKRHMSEIEEIIEKATALANELCTYESDRLSMVCDIVANTDGILKVNNLHRKTFVIE